ncbi:MAG: hypothetical protein QM765_14795 [Myxococcales bacterium]
MYGLVSLVVVVSHLATATAAAPEQVPPAEVLKRVEKAGEFLDTFVGSCRTVVNAVVSKTDGSDPEVNFAEALVTRTAEGTKTETILRSTKNGADTTAESRAKREKAKAKQEDGKAKFKLDVPGAKTAEHFVYSTQPSQGNICRAKFTPAEAHRKVEGISSGELAWRCDSLEPLWMTATPLDPPSRVSEVMARMEFARAGGTYYVAKLATDGVGGILFIKRKFKMTVDITDVALAEAVATPAGPSPSSAPQGSAP